MTKKQLRVGRVYIINPDPIPNYNKKQRPAIYLGFNRINDQKRYLFIQIGSSEVQYKPILVFKNEIQYFWKKLGQDSYLHIDISKYEFFRVAKHPMLLKGDYLELEKKDCKKLRNIYNNRIKELEDIRLKKAKIFTFQNEFKKAKKQLIMLKQIMPKKHKKMHPDSLIKKWKKTFKSL